MSSNKRVATYAASGVLIAGILIALVTLGPTVLFPVRAGTLDIKVTDAPVQDLTSLNITVDSFEVQRENDTWVNVPISGGNATFDLVKLKNVTQDVALAQIEPGNYTKIRMHILSAMAQVNNSVPFPVRFPPNKIDIIVHFEVKAGQTTGLILDIQVDTIKIAANPQSNVSPVVKAMVIPPD